MANSHLGSMKLSTYEDETNELQDELEHTPEVKNNFGKLIVFRKEKPHLSIGPDWPFTICATFMFLGFAFGLYKFRSIVTFGEMGSLIHWIFTLFPLCSFIFTALSNPGIYDCYQNDQPKIKYCEVCRVFKPKKVYHCRECNICIEGMDHHCPWISKCVGKKNLIAFYVFVTSVPLTFVYFIYLVVVSVGAHQKA